MHIRDPRLMAPTNKGGRSDVAVELAIIRSSDRLISGGRSGSAQSAHALRAARSRPLLRFPLPAIMAWKQSERPVRRLRPMHGAVAAAARGSSDLARSQRRTTRCRLDGRSEDHGSPSSAIRNVVKGAEAYTLDGDTKRQDNRSCQQRRGALLWRRDSLAAFRVREGRSRIPVRYGSRIRPSLRNGVVLCLTVCGTSSPSPICRTAARSYGAGQAQPFSIGI